MKYRPEIDGLRALAVVPVILFHAGFEVFAGGFVGVDVFFVISGFLITTILLEDIEKERFSIVHFYERRARRILPALFFAVLLTLLFSLVFLPPHALKDVGQSIFAVSLFLSNVFFFLETDYFANTSEMAPLLHTWSLGVEEQFYILFPFILLLLRHLSRSWQFLILSGVALSSLILSEWVLQFDEQLSFFMIFTRFWELSVGSLLALGTFDPRQRIPRVACDFVSLLGLLFILFAVLNYSERTAFPGFNAVVPVAGTALIILCTSKDTLIGSLLSFRPFVAVGLLSYSLYLSHNVVFALSRNIGVSLSSFSIKIGLIILSVLIALFSFRFIEKPLRYVNYSSKKYLAASVLACLAFASVGLFLHKTDGLKSYKLSQLNEAAGGQVIDLNVVLPERQRFWNELLGSSGAPFSSDADVRKVLILGDSKSQDLYVSLVGNSDNGKYEFRQMTLDDTAMGGLSGTRANNDNLAAVLASSLFEDADEIVLTATWQLRSTKGVDEFVKLLIANDKDVSLVSTANFNDVASLSYVVAKRKLTGSALEAFLFDNIRRDWRSTYLKLRELIEDSTSEVRFLEKLDAFCDFERRICRLKDEADWYFYDSGHLTVKGAEYFGSFAVKNWFSN